MSEARERQIPILRLSGFICVGAWPRGLNSGLRHEITIV